MFLSVIKRWGSGDWQAKFVLKPQKESEDFESGPVACIIHRGLKREYTNRRLFVKPFR